MDREVNEERKVEDLTLEEQEASLDAVLQSLEKRIAPCLCSGNCQS